MTILDSSAQAEVLLIQPEYGEEVTGRIFQPGMEFPYSLTCLSSYIEREGISNEIYDARLRHKGFPDLADVLKRLRPRVVGVTSVTSGIARAAEVARTVKEVDGSALTVIGGCHASALPEETLRSLPDFDYLIHGEGEIPFARLVTCSRHDRRDIEGLKGVAFRRNGTVVVNPREALIADLDEIPFPARHKIDVERYAPTPGTRNYLRLPTTGLSVGRGCPYNCLFCYKGVWGKSVRFRSPLNVIREVEECIDRYGIRDFRFYDDVLTFPKWDIAGFCNEVLSRKLDISWSCWSRVNDVDYEKLVLMKRAGCYHIKYGIEFGSEKALKLSRKGITLDQSRRAIAMTKSLGIECKGSFIFGIPGETLEDCRQTIDFALELSPDFATFYAYDCIPGSTFYQQIKDRSFTGPLLPRDETENLVSEAYRRFYIRPRFVLERLKKLAATPWRELSGVFSGARMMAAFFLRKLVGREPGESRRR